MLVFHSYVKLPENASRSFLVKPPNFRILQTINPNGCSSVIPDPHLGTQKKNSRKTINKRFLEAQFINVSLEMGKQTNINKLCQFLEIHTRFQGRVKARGGTWRSFPIVGRGSDCGEPLLGTLGTFDAGCMRCDPFLISLLSHPMWALKMNRSVTVVSKGIVNLTYWKMGLILPKVLLTLLVMLWFILCERCK